MRSSPFSASSRTLAVSAFGVCDRGHFLKRMLIQRPELKTHLLDLADCVGFRFLELFYYFARGACSKFGACEFCAGAFEEFFCFFEFFKGGFLHSSLECSLAID